MFVARPVILWIHIRLFSWVLLMGKINWFTKFSSQEVKSSFPLTAMTHRMQALTQPLTDDFTFQQPHCLWDLGQAVIWTGWWWPHNHYCSQHMTNDLKCLSQKLHFLAYKSHEILFLCSISHFSRKTWITFLKISENVLFYPWQHIIQYVTLLKVHYLFAKRWWFIAGFRYPALSYKADHHCICVKF